MKERSLFLRLKGSLALLAGAVFFCSLFSGPVRAAEERKTQAGEVSKEISEAFEAIESYTFARKEEFLKWAEARSQERDARIAEMEKEIERSNEKMRERLKSARDDLREEQRKLAKRMEEVRKSSEAVWEDAKWGFSAALEKLERAYERAKSRFEEEEAEGAKE